MNFNNIKNSKKMYYKSITEKKNRLNKLSNKENILEVKQKLFSELTTNSSRKFKYKGKEGFTYKFINPSKFKNNEEIFIPDNNNINKDTYLQKTNISTQNENRTKYNSKSHNYKNQTLNVINSIPTSNYINHEEDDLIFVIDKEPNKVNEKSKLNIYNIDNNKDNNLISHLALPSCHYHKFNSKLPKRYTCNFKNCSCCQFKERENYNENTKETSRDYIYPSIEKILNTKKRFNSSLEKFMKKSKNKNKEDKNKENLKKKEKKKKVEENFNVKTRENLIKKSINICLKNSNKNNDNKKKKRTSSNNSLDSDQISDISIKFQKPDETNLKMPKKAHVEKDKSLSKSFSLEIPEELNIEDENDLKEFKYLMKEKNRKSKIHFSVNYYQKLNKSYKVYYNNCKHFSPFKAKSKEKHFEFLRYKS